MLAILGLLGVLIWEVHHHRSVRLGEPAIVENLSLRTELIA
jgi:hypothetical protein